MSETGKFGYQSEVVSDLVKSSLSQAQKSHQTYVELSQQISSGAESGTDINQKALELAHTDVTSNLAFAQKVFDVSSEEELTALLSEHASSQDQDMAVHVADLNEMANSDETEPGGEPQIVPEISAPQGEAIDASAVSVAAAAVAATATAAVQASPAEVPFASLDEEDAGEVIETAEISNEVATDPGVLPIADVASLEVPETDATMQAEIDSLAVKIHEAKNLNDVTSEGNEIDLGAEFMGETAPEVIIEAADVSEIPGLSEEVPAVIDFQEPNAETPAAVEFTEHPPEALIEEVSQVPVAESALRDFPEVSAEIPAVVEMPETMTEIASIAPELEIASEVPAVEAVPEINAEVPIVEAVPEINVEVPAVEAVPEITAEVPAVEAVPEIAAEVPAVEAVPEIAAEVPAAEAAPEVATESPVVDIVPGAAVAAPIVGLMPDVTAETSTIEEIPEPEVAASQQAFDKDLSARLDAVRAMLQGS